MEWMAIFGFASQYGVPALLVAVLIVLVVLVGKIEANTKADQARGDGLRKEIADAEARTKKNLEEHEARIRTMELEYLTKAEFYREVGGWRTDMDHLSQKMDKQANDVRDLIINLWKSKAEEGKST